jgi:E3 ubiquitin-protein ligase NEDD4
VTDANKKEYVDAIVEYRVHKRVLEQSEAIMEGLSELIPTDLLNVLDERELELLISGVTEVDMCALFLTFLHLLTFASRDDWTKFTDYRGYEKSDPIIEWFWQMLRRWPSERKSRLLQFTTGTSRYVFYD